MEFSGNSVYPLSDLLAAAIVGIRLDAVVIGYLQVPLTLMLVSLYFLRSTVLFNSAQRFTAVYLSFFYLLVSILAITDFGYFSFLNEHITIMIYGILDDDTAALWNTMQANYNPLLILLLVAFYAISIYLILRSYFRKTLQWKAYALKPFTQILFVVLLIGLNLLVIRGTFGMQPISKVIPDISSDKFVNELPNNGLLAFIKASKHYKKSKLGEYDLIKSTNYTDKMDEAFSYLANKEVKKDGDYLSAITWQVPRNDKIEQLRPHVVVIMVESFGLPITEYQSQEFNILGRLKKHFDEDTLFTNFISSSNGTISSLEPLLLNITARPNSTSLGQSRYQYTSYTQASAKVYQKAGYETHFVYGGDLQWRNVGKFMSLQGFQHQEGKVDIISALNLDKETSSHDWGVFDQYAYDYVLKTLKEAETPQFIFLLTTNNHPPFTTPKEYQANSLKCNDELESCMIGDHTLIQKRLFDYQYALDMAGRFMDDIKNGELAEKTVVAITADNNTIEGRIRYKDPVSMSKKIPFYLYAPASIKQKEINTQVAGSHKDLFATLYHQSLSDIEYISVGKNLFDKRLRHCGFNDGGIIISDGGAFEQHKTLNDIQLSCDKEHDAALAISDWLIRIYPKSTDKR